MGLFSNPKPLHPRFELPKVSPRDCSRMALPHMSSMLMPNLKWFEWQAKQGQDQTYWWSRIFDSEEYWENNNIDVGQFAFNVAHSAAAREGLEQNKEIVEDIFINAKLGVLAGMFEKASQTTSAEDCHPVVWNAMNFFNMGVRDMEGRPRIPESSLLLRECTTWAGYALGKIPGITVEQVFARWR
jgi:hypothetical protein